MPAGKAGSVVLGSTAVVATGLASLWMWRSLSKYGWRGTIRLVWEGDAYTPEAREAMQKIDKAQSSIRANEKVILELELTLARARLDSIDETVVVPQWIVCYMPRNLEKDLAKLSYDLDSLAATVDSVVAVDDGELKQRKKLYSEQLVFMMERADVLLECYNEKEGG